jgi:Mitochondrial K+-H+ exchange-related
LSAAIVYLVPVGAGRFELYSEAPDDVDVEGQAPPDEGFWQRTIHNAQVRWHEAVHSARSSESSGGWFARLRDRAVCRAAESIAEQRTLWSLRNCTSATLVHPSDLTHEAADELRKRLLSRARQHHGRWLAIDTLLLAVSGLLALVPGPNVLAYYFVFRVVGHYLSWRGARQALEAIAWTTHAEPALAELGRLAALPRDARQSRVEAIAGALNLPRLAAFFERTAVPVR